MKLLYKNINLFKIFKTSVPCLIAPIDIVSYKILSFPFELKNPKNYEELVRTSLENLVPLNIGDLYIIVNKISKNKILVEYLKKESLENIFLKDEGLNDILRKKKIRIYAPFFLIHSYFDEGEKPPKIFSVLWKQKKEENGIKFTYLDGELNEIEELGTLNPALNTGDTASPVFDLKVVEPNAGAIALDSFLKNKKRISYISYGGSNVPEGGITGSKIRNYFKKAAAASLSLLIIISAYLYLNTYYKYKEIKAIQLKINKIMLKYYPEQKVFYEPKFDIKSHFDKLRASNYSGKESENVLNFLNYISGFKNSRGLNSGSIKLKNISYSFGSVNFSGKMKTGNGFANLLRYLKEKYKTIKVIKSNGADFDVLIKL